MKEEILLTCVYCNNKDSVKMTTIYNENHRGVQVDKCTACNMQTGVKTALTLIDII